MSDAALDRGSLEEREWVSTGARGRTVLSRGWQGENSCVLVRHAPTGFILQAYMVGQFAREIKVTSGNETAVRFEVHEPIELSEDSRFVLRPLQFDRQNFPYPDQEFGPQNVSVPLDVHASPAGTMVVPHGQYRISLETTHCRVPLCDFTADRSEMTVDLNVPSVGAITGIAQGSMCGPLAGAVVKLSYPDHRWSARSTTFFDGSFQVAGLLSVDPLPSITVAIDGEAQLLNAESIEWTREESRVLINVPQAEMRLVMHSEDALAQRGYVRLSGGETGGQSFRFRIRLDEDRVDSGHLIPPGEYLIERVLGRRILSKQECCLPADRRTEIVLPAAKCGLLAVRVFPPITGTASLKFAMPSIGDSAPHAVHMELDAAQREPEIGTAELAVPSGDHEIEVHWELRENQPGLDDYRSVHRSTHTVHITEGGVATLELSPPVN